MKIVHCTRDCEGIIAGVQHVDGPLQVKYWGSEPVTPAALTPMLHRRQLHGADRPRGQKLWGRCQMSNF